MFGTSEAEEGLNLEHLIDGAADVLGRDGTAELSHAGCPVGGGVFDAGDLKHGAARDAHQEELFAELSGVGKQPFQNTPPRLMNA